jgi:hypothetical protein
MKLVTRSAGLKIAPAAKSAVPPFEPLRLAAFGGKSSPYAALALLGVPWWEFRFEVTVSISNGQFSMAPLERGPVFMRKKVVRREGIGRDSV